MALSLEVSMTCVYLVRWNWYPEGWRRVRTYALDGDSRIPARFGSVVMRARVGNLFLVALGGWDGSLFWVEFNAKSGQTSEFHTTFCPSVCPVYI